MARYLAGLAAHAVRRRFRELESLPENGLWRASRTWGATCPTERYALGLMGLDRDEAIPLPPVIQGHGSRGRIFVAIRGDAAERLGMDIPRIERAVAASVGPAAACLGFEPPLVEQIDIAHLMGNDRVHYIAPAVAARARWGQSVDEAVHRCILHAAANTAYGYTDRADRLLDISGLGEDLRIERLGPHHLIEGQNGEDYYLVSRVRFSVAGRLYGPLFLPDRLGLERAGVALIDRQSTAIHRVAA